jgi:bleomycin hydrolase
MNTRSHVSALFVMAALPAFAQTPPAPEAKPNRTFTVETEVKRTSVKAQGKSGTCWCFATSSFMESELLRLGKAEIGLSEMFVIRHTWPEKSWGYFRMQGVAPWSPGGQAHDWINAVKAHGIVPRDVYTGLGVGETTHNHGEMDAGLKGFLDAAAKGKQPTTKWPAGFQGILDAYLGKPPANFSFQGKTFTPEAFRDSLGLDLDGYVELTSFTHHPYYKPFRLEIPDNWAQDNRYYNLPLAELEQVMEGALKNGYSFVWDGDVSEKEFSQKTIGYAFVPKVADQKNAPTIPEAELEPTAELRQLAFNDFRTTDDHLMHIVGLAKDQAGNRFFLTKNSWGDLPVTGPHKGYVYMSRSFVLMKGIAILVHRKAIPSAIAAKLGL